ncbi:MAG: VWA containing CoxE family protein [Oscillospiraceae bacterium]|nr:VWA containing CoxE family protein [Oscillospiraceae bacterium]
MFTPLFYLLRGHGLDVSLGEWMSLLDAMDKGLHQSSLTEFYYLARAVLVKTEADFDKFDGAFLEYFKDVKTFDALPQALLDWLANPHKQAAYDKNEVDKRIGGLTPEQIKQMLQERFQEQRERHDGGRYWVGTGGTSAFGHSGYAPQGIRVGGESRRHSALQVAAARNFRDFREDHVLDSRQFQLAFRRLRQFSADVEGPKEELQLDETIQKTCDNAGNLELVFGRPRRNAVKVMLLFDSGGSMWPYTELCTLLFQTAVKSGNFKDLKIYYFHNCWYDDLYTQPSCDHCDAIPTEWVLHNIKSDYKVIVVGDASMAPYELLYKGGCSDYYVYNEQPGLDWIRRTAARYEKMVWLNPMQQGQWFSPYGDNTVKIVSGEVPMYPLTIQGLEQSMKYLVSARSRKEKRTG